VLIVDAGPLYAAADTSDNNHIVCDELLNSAKGPLLVPERHRATEIATLDRRHFSVVRPGHVPSFTLLP
jgi:predicted nucleic acid-binding protein